MTGVRDVILGVICVMVLCKTVSLSIDWEEYDQLSPDTKRHITTADFAVYCVSRFLDNVCAYYADMACNMTGSCVQ